MTHFARRAPRRDAGEPAIVDALRAAGALVFQLDGRDLPDLLVGVRGRWVLVEVKQPLGPRHGRSQDGQHLSPGQQRFFDLAKAAGLPVAVVRGVDEALGMVGR